MAPRPRFRPSAAVAAALLAPVAATAAAWLLQRLVSVAGLAMVYLVATVLCAAVAGRAAGILAAVLGVTALNFFFVPPRYTLRVEGAEYWWTLAVLLGFSLAASAGVSALREGRSRARLEHGRAQDLLALSEALSGAGHADAMCQRAADWLQARLARSCAVFLLGPEGVLRHWSAPEGLEVHESAARWAIDHARPMGRGCPDWPDLPLWCAPLSAAGASGAVQVLLGARDRPAEDELEHWAALVRQAGLCIARAHAAAAAQQAQEQALAEAARNTLLASLSHDLRTPLTGIVGTASALRTQGDAMPAAQRAQLLANLENEAADLVLMADNVLQMARLSQPQAALRKDWESVGDIVAAAAQRVRRRWPSAALHLRITPGLPPVRAEAALLAQALANLMENAVRHAQGRPQLTVTAGRSREGVFIALRDQGRGLPPGDPAALFERYAQGDRAGAGAGAGLGLAICRLIVQAHGGTLEARRCEPGAEFRIDLPAGEVPKAMPEAAP